MMSHVVVSRLKSDARRSPFSVGAALALWIVGVTSGSLASGPAPSLGSAIGAGGTPLSNWHWWSPISSSLWCANIGSYLASSAVLLVICVPLERRIGTRRAAALFAITQAVGVAVSVGGVALGTAAGETWSVALASQIAVGPWAGITGFIVAACCTLPSLRSRQVTLLMIVTLGMLALYSGQLSDVIRLTGASAGLLLGPVMLKDLRRAWSVPSPRERRTLVALLVAASALGPLLAVVGDTTMGPFSVLQSLMITSPPSTGQLQAACSDLTDAAYCRLLQTQSRLTGLGAALMSVLPVLILLAVAEGLRRGRRFAYYSAIVVNLVLSALGGLLLHLSVLELSDSAAVRSAVGPQWWIERTLPVLIPLLVVALLMRNTSRFQVQAPTGTYRRLVRTVAITGTAVAVGYVITGWLVRSQFDANVSVAQLIADLPSRLLPPGYLGLSSPAFTPIGGVAIGLYEWIGVTFWTVLLASVLASYYRSRVVPDAEAAARAKVLIKAYGSHSLSYMGTWTGNRYWFTEDKTTVIAYRVTATVALTMADPIGPVEHRQDALRGFAEFCQANNWTPCLYSINPMTAQMSRQLGWKSLHIAEDTTLELTDLHFTGKKWQDIRTALNRATKSGMTALWTTYPTAGPHVTHQIDSIAAQWIADKKMPEMGFTLGSVPELNDPDVRCLIALDTTGQVVAITSWLPMHHHGQVVGWTLDMMRRRPQAPAGVMEYLIATAALQFKNEGAQTISLSGAPLARISGDHDPAPLRHLLDFIGATLEPAYGFRSLLAFKAKFQPTYSPLYMSYPDQTDLASIANAIGRAYLPHATGRQTLQLMWRLASR